MTEKKIISSRGRFIDSRIISRRQKRIIISAVLAVVILVADLVVLSRVVPWAHERYLTVQGSGGYVMIYLTILFTVIAFFALMTYVFQRDSYPSDRWQ